MLKNFGELMLFLAFFDKTRLIKGGGLYYNCMLHNMKIMYLQCIDNKRINLHNIPYRGLIMEMTNLNIRTEKAIKEQAEAIFNELGLNMTTAINMFLRSTIRERGIPFDLKLEVFNETTLKAIEEGDRIASDPSTPSYSDIESLKKALDV